MKLAEILNTIISIVAGTITIFSTIGLFKVSDDTKTLTIQQGTIYIFLGIGLVVFIASLWSQKKKISNNFSVVKKQFQFGGTNNRQNMS